MPLMANAEAGENEAPIGMVCSGGTAVIKDLGRYVLDGARSGRVTNLSFLFLELWRIRKPYSKSSLDTLLGVTKVGSLLHRSLSSHFGVDCWFVRAENLEYVVDGLIVCTMDGIRGRNEVRPGAQYWFMWRSKSIH